MPVDNNSKLILDKAVSDPIFREALVRENFYWFIHIYFPDYITYPFAKFHKEMVFSLQEIEDNLVIAAFRGSGKSTIVSLAYVIWSMIGKSNKRFVVICSNTSRQAELLMFNIKNTLEIHPLLKDDLGPFSEFSEEWNVSSLVFKKYDAKIMAISVNESVRGIRYKNQRPDLIILDDVETLDSVRTEENRDKLNTWFDRDIIPLGDEKTNIIVIGTIMTTGSLIQTLNERIKLKLLAGSSKRYPIVDEKWKILWPERWKTKRDIENYRKKFGIVDRTWETEYLLNDYVEEDQIVKPEMIKYYDELPFGYAHFLGGYIGVDLAISMKTTASKTAIVAGYAFKIDGKNKLYLLANPVNKRLDSHETIEAIKNLADSMHSGRNTKIFVEDVGYQRSVIETLNNEGYNANPFEVRGQDKESRLEITLHNLVQGLVLFPKTGCEDLIVQLIRFRLEKFKDLGDAYSIVVIKAFDELNKGPGVIAVPCRSIKNSSNYLDYGDRHGPRFSFEFRS